ncbi:MAG: hypothetical protein IKU94_05275 [Bacteroidaceae bacterium]|nr:hypothetical protein [Bacteroidaceae bacterium]
MGKISDIWVRLGLKKDDFDKGMDDAAKKTEGVGGAFGKMKATALAVWAAIGTAAVKFAQDLIASTNRMGDAWAVFTSQSKAAWDTFLSAVSSWDFSNFFRRMKEAAMEAAEFAKAMDASFEINNSIALQRAAMSKELAALKIAMQDATKTYDERIKAAQDYLAKVKPIYDQIEAEAKRMEDAHLGKWLAGAGLGDSEQVRADIRKFLVELGQNNDLVDNLTYLLANRERYTMALSNLHSGNLAEKARGPLQKFANEYAAMQQMVKNYGTQAGYGTGLYDLFRVYTNMRGDKDTAPLVQAMIDAYNAQGLYSRETQEIQSVMNGLVNQAATAAVTEAAKNAPKDVSKSLQKDLNSFIKDMSLSLDKVEIGLEVDDAELAAVDELLNSITDEYFAAHQRIMDLNNAIAQSIEDTLITSMSNGLQAITDMMFGLEGANMRGVLAAFIAPFGDMMKNLGALIMEGGIAASALKNLIKDPTLAIAAGAALMALGSMVSSGVQRMVSTGSGSGSVATTGAASAETETIKTELTVYVEGKISGKDIILAGNNTRNSWRR